MNLIMINDGNKTENEFNFEPQLSINVSIIFYVIQWFLFFSDNICKYFGDSNGKKRRFVDIFRAEGRFCDLHNCLSRQHSISGINKICVPSFNSDGGFILPDI